MTATREGLLALREELTAIQSKSIKTALDLHRVSEIAEQIEELGRKAARDRQARDRDALQNHLETLGNAGEVAGVAGADLGSALRQAGFRPGGPRRRSERASAHRA